MHVNDVSFLFKIVFSFRCFFFHVHPCMGFDRLAFFTGNPFCESTARRLLRSHWPRVKNMSFSSNTRTKEIAWQTHVSLCWLAIHFINVLLKQREEVNKTASPFACFLWRSFISAKTTWNGFKMVFKLVWISMKGWIKHFGHGSCIL